MKSGLFQFDPNPGVVPPGSITNAELADMVAHTVKARAANSTGSPQDVPIDATLTFILDATLGRAAITGDVSVPSGSNTSTISNLALSKLANAAAQFDIVGRKTAGSGSWEDCTRADLNLARTDVAQSLVGTQTINGAALTAAKLTQTTSGTDPTNAALVLESTDGGASGPTTVHYHNSASPAANDLCRVMRAYFNNTSAASWLAGGLNVFATDVTAGSEDSELRFTTTVAGGNANRLVVGQGVYTAAATGGDPGLGNVNATNYFDDGVNINTIYAALAAANVFSNAAGQTITQTTAPATSPGGGTLLLQNTDSGVAGPILNLYHNSSSPAVSDIPGSIVFWSLNASAADFRNTLIRPVMDAVTAGAESAHLDFRVIQAGSIGVKATIGAGLYVGGTDPGAGSIATSTTGFSRAGVFTVGTLPAAGTAGAGARASVTDSLAPAYLVNIAAGGAAFSPVISDGTNWKSG